jgi:hypothetical protein
MPNTGSDTSIETEPIGEVADDALRIFRMNILVIAVYSSIVGLMYQNNPEAAKDILQSNYTIFGMLFWLGTSIGTITTYRGARKFSTAPAHTDPDAILDSIDPDIVVNNMIVDALALLVSIFAFFFGFADGVSQEGIPIELAAGITFAGFAAVGTIMIIIKGAKFSSNVVSIGIEKSQGRLMDSYHKLSEYTEKE